MKKPHGLKGKPKSEEHKRKMSESRIGKKGRKHTEETKRKIGAANSVSLLGNIPHNKGKKASKEAREKMSASRKGKKTGRVACSCFKKGHKGHWTGKKMSEDTRKKMSDSQKKRFFNVEKKDKKHRFTFEYKEWRRRVFERDDYRCQKCGQRGGLLNAHHKKQYAHHPDVRLDINNGETLCEKCHRKVYVKKANSKIGDDVFTHEDNRRTIYDWYNAEFGVSKSNKVVFIEDTIPIGDHFHLNKDEIFFLVCGEFLEVVLGEKTIYHIPAPYKIIVPRGTYHKFICSPGSILVGVATERFDPNDEIRKDA